MTNTKRRTKPCAIMIESRGGVLYDEFAKIEPTEFKVRSKKKRQRDQEEAWADFDRELREKIRRGEFRVNPVGEIENNGKV